MCVRALLSISKWRHLYDVVAARVHEVGVKCPRVGSMGCIEGSIWKGRF